MVVSHHLSPVGFGLELKNHSLVLIGGVRGRLVWTAGALRESAAFKLHVRGGKFGGFPSQYWGLVLSSFERMSPFFLFSGTLPQVKTATTQSDLCLILGENAMAFDLVSSGMKYAMAFTQICFHVNKAYEHEETIKN
ncbi:hypothetical protein Bca4012_056409 [Brassica carinata]|uniref:Uncharacterized protein n=1 Tax=Brassica carinata TaxID=52824 RepID=A0A8X7W1J0_BRACI|nr:hypothetical protein Bca52824_013763 [Brassica carinata]